MPYERPDPIEDERPITDKQRHYLLILAEWLQYRGGVVHIKASEVLGYNIVNIGTLTCKEASKVIDTWKKLRQDIEND